MTKSILSFVFLLNVIYTNAQVQCLNEDFESYNSQSDLVSITGNPNLTWNTLGSATATSLMSNTNANTTQFVRMTNCGISDPVLEPHGGFNNSIIALPINCSIDPCDKIRVSIDTRSIATSAFSPLYNSDVYVNMRLVESNPILNCLGGILTNCLTATTNYTDIRFDISYDGSLGGFGPWETFVEYIDNNTLNAYNYMLIWFEHVPGTLCIDHGLDNVTIEVVETFEDAVNIQDTYIGCDNVYEEICGPFGANYSYQWYGTPQGGNTSILMGEDQCFTPSQAGDYILIVTDSNGEYSCTNTQTITVLDGIPIPTLGTNGEICKGATISIDDQSYNNPDYAITWYHNGNQVQQGGTTLQTSFISGVITVEISYGACDPVTASVTLIDCCPDGIALSIDCENQTVVIENLPSNATILEIIWTFNGAYISPQPPFTTALNAFLGEGTYGATILFQLSNGQICKLKSKTQYKEANCCNEIEPIANAHFVNIEGYQTTFTDPYGNVEIPILCDFILDASNSLCEDEYTINISELDPLTWTTTTVFPWTGFSGQAGSSIDLSQFATFIPGQAYLLAFNAGPNGTSVYLPFIYGLDAEVEIINVDDYFTLYGTIYGNIEVPKINCENLQLDGSKSSCENAYRVRIQSFNPVFPNWNVTYSQTSPSGPGLIYDQTYTTPAPSNIIVPANSFPSNYTGYYLVSLSVGPTWTEADFELIWYECDNFEGSSTAENRSPENLNLDEDQISLYPNPTNDLISLITTFKNGIYQLYDVQGKLIKQDILMSKETSIDLSLYNSGVYYFRIQNENGEVHFKKIIKN